MELREKAEHAAAGAAGDLVAVMVEPRPGHSDQQVVSSLQAAGAADVVTLAPGFISARVSALALPQLAEIAYVHPKVTKQLRHR